MLEFFTDRARQAVVSSQDEAIALGHDFIGTEHILLGILAAGEGRGLEVLAALDGDPDGLREAALARVSRDVT